MTEIRPTAVRHLVIAVSVMMSIKLYIDRLCFGTIQPFITEDLGLTAQSLSILWFVFFISYAAGQVPAGWLGDRFGPRTMLAVYILTWSLFTAVAGAAMGLLALVVSRLGCGLGQAGAYPACGTLLRRWVPTSSRGLASSFVAAGGRIGALLSPIVTALLIIAFVPPGTSVEITADQVLDPARLAARLMDARPATAAGHIARMLPHDVRGSLKNFEKDWRTWDGQRATLEKQDPKPQIPPAPQLSGSQLGDLLRGLNERLDDPRLTQGHWLTTRSHPFSNLAPEREARDAMTRLEAGQMLTSLELRRLNRMILEAALPEIRNLYCRGWRPVLWLYGGTGILVAGIFWLVFRDHPREHPWCNEAERSLIEAGQPPVPPRAATGIPWGAILRSRSMWLSSILQFCTNIGWLLVVNSLSRYFDDVYRLPLLDRSQLTALPPLGGLAGMYLGGWVTDVLSRRMGVRWGRALPMALTRFGAAAAYVACMLTTDPVYATIAMTIMFFFVDLGVAATWAFCQDVGGKSVGAVLGWGNMWGNVGAAVATPLYDLCLGSAAGRDQWNLTFALLAGVFAISGFAALAIDASKPLVAEEEPPA